MKAPKSVIPTTVPSYSMFNSASGGKAMSRTRCMAACKGPAWSAAISTVPSSCTSMSAPVSCSSSRMTLPFGPMTSPILSIGTLTDSKRGANSRSSERGASMASAITSNTARRASLAWAKAPARTSEGRPSIFISNCRAVITSAVPATLKSISPKASSAPKMSVRVTYLSPSATSPMAMPATGASISTPASISDRAEAHTEAMEDDPLEDRTSDTRRNV